MSSTRIVIRSHQADIADSGIRLAASDPNQASAADSRHLLNRLSHLRTILPVFAQELAVARRLVASLRTENGALQQSLLYMQMQAPATPRSMFPASSARAGRDVAILRAAPAPHDSSLIEGSTALTPEE
jgi:hypothetical protein